MSLVDRSLDIARGLATLNLSEYDSLSHIELEVLRIAQARLVDSQRTTHV